jgi:putative endonuclease
MKSYFVYIITNKENGVLYIGVTNDLHRRIYEHKNKLIKGFSSKYSLDKLVYFEETGDIQSALNREKQLKKWNRSWKIELIERYNPEWKDLVL